MIRYVTHDEINFRKWDHCIDRSVNGIFYAYSWYLDLVAESWDALIEGDYRSVMPLPFKKKYGFYHIYQPFFTQQLGIFSTHSLSAMVSNRFFQAIPDKFKLVDIQLNTYNKLEYLEGVRSSPLPTYELDLIGPYNKLLKAFSTNTIRNIAKARKSNVYTTSSGHPEDIIQVFRNNRGRQIKTFTESDYTTLKHLIYKGISKGVVQIYSAYSSQNELCAGLVFFRSHSKVVFLFSGATPLSRSNGAMFLLFDHFIRDHAGQNLVLDFEGSSDSNLARFYRGFGSKECVFLRTKLNRLPFWLKPLPEIYLLLKHIHRAVL